MKFAVVLMPSWSIQTAPLGISMVAAAAKRSTFEVRTFDSNSKIWQSFRENQQDPWTAAYSTDWYIKEDFELKLRPQMESHIEKAVNEILEWEPDVVGFSIFLTSVYCTRIAAKMLREKRPNIKIIYGGPEATAAQLEFHREFEDGYLDYAIIGEGELTLIEVLNRIQSGRDLKGCLGTAYRDEKDVVVYEPIRPNIKLEDLPFPDFSDLNFDHYREKALPVMMSRGCVAKCTFCAETRFWKSFRFRSADSVFQEFKSNIEKYKINRFAMADSLINGNFNVLSDLTDKIINSGIQMKWGGYARVDKRMTFDLLGRLAKSGLFLLNFGLETGSQKVMDLMDKRTTVEDAHEVIYNAYQFGINVFINIIIGFPGEDEVEYNKTVDFILKRKREIHAINTGETLAINPGTPLWDHPEKFGVVANAAGTALVDDHGSWITLDGGSTREVRINRLERFRKFLDEEKIFWWPSGRNAKHGVSGVNVDQIMQNPEIYAYNPAKHT